MAKTIPLRIYTSQVPSEVINIQQVSLAIVKYPIVLIVTMLITAVYRPELKIIVV